MYPDYQDRRRFQIAVIGSPTSDEVIYLPPEHRDFYRVKRILGSNRCYCGKLLGGCGGELVPTKGAHRVCFLRHLPGAGCSLEKLHEAAADHMFIARDIKNLLQENGTDSQKPRYEFPELPIGAGVAVRHGRSGLVYAHLSNASAGRWEETPGLKEFRASNPSVLYGEAVSPGLIDLDTRGFALRVRCETHGGDRSTSIGTQVGRNKTCWTPIRKCFFAHGEILTPFLERHKGMVVPTEEALQERSHRSTVFAMPQAPEIDPSLVSLRRRYESARDSDDLLELFLVREELAEIQRQHPNLLGLDRLWSAVQKLYRRLVPPYYLVSVDFWGTVAEYVRQRRQLQRETLLGIYHRAEALNEGDSKSRTALEWMRSDLGFAQPGTPIFQIGSNFDTAEFESVAKDTWSVLKEAAAKQESITWTALNRRLDGKFNGIATSQVIDMFLYIQQDLLGISTPVSALVATSKGLRHPDFYDGVLERLGTKPETVRAIESCWRRDRKLLFRRFGRP